MTKNGWSFAPERAERILNLQVPKIDEELSDLVHVSTYIGLSVPNLSLVKAEFQELLQHIKNFEKDKRKKTVNLRMLTKLDITE